MAVMQRAEKEIHEEEEVDAPEVRGAGDWKT